VKDPFGIIIQPLLTERSTALREERGKYSFWVSKKANKIEIKHLLRRSFPVLGLLMLILWLCGANLCAEEEEKRTNDLTGKKRLSH